MVRRSLEGIPTIELDRRVFRIAVKAQDVLAIAEEDGLSVEQAAELARLDMPLDVLDAPFMPSRFPVGRFSDGSFGVFYSAEVLETARLEKGYWVAKGGGTAAKQFFGQWSCRFAGPVRDLLPYRDEWPELTDDDYSECRSLAREARAARLDGLRSPSARHRPDGACVPAFSRAALSALQEHGLVAFEVEGGVASFEEVGT